MGAELGLTHAVVVGANWETCSSLALLNLHRNADLPAQWGIEPHGVHVGCGHLPWGGSIGSYHGPTFISSPAEAAHRQISGQKTSFECVLHLALRFVALFLLVTSAQLFLCITAPDEVSLLI